MIKLVNVRWIHSRNLTQEDRDELLISKKYDGKIALETYSVNLVELKRKAVPVKDFVAYIRGHGELKESDVLDAKDGSK